MIVRESARYTRYRAGYKIIRINLSLSATALFHEDVAQSSGSSGMRYLKLVNKFKY